MKSMFMALCLIMLGSAAQAYDPYGRYTSYTQPYCVNPNVTSPIIGPCYGTGAGTTYANTYQSPGTGISTTEYNGAVNGTSSSYTTPGTGITTTQYNMW